MSDSWPAICYFSQPSDAPHQNMMLRHWKDMSRRDLDFLKEIAIPTSSRKLDVIRFVWAVIKKGVFARREVLYFSGFASARYALVAHMLRHPRIVYHSQDWVLDRRDFRAFAEKLVVRSAALVIWNERTRARAAARIAKRAGKLLVVPTYLPLAYPIPEPDAGLRDAIRSRGVSCTESTVIVFAGGYSDERLSSKLIQAATGRNCVVVFTGSHRPTTSIPPNVVDLGKQSFERMLSIVAASDIGVLLYDYKRSFGNRFQQPGRLTEYLRAGLAVISTPFPAAKRIERDLSTFLCVNGYDIEELGSALDKLSNQIRLGEVSRGRIMRYAEENLSYEPAADVISQFIVKNMK
ncbi:hypothetical protein NKH74_16510 [Mesorhizobium sp. M0933]|uniref:hypothetical protein n=1 Tax=Mesorhizobium sp. M0933 TaxID=2957030 RepID=UPI0033399A00